MPELIIPFGQVLEDQPSFRNPGIITARNVIPRKMSYAPFRSLKTISNALTNKCLGAVSAIDVSGNIFVYAGDTTRLYEMVDNTFTDESKGATTYTAADDFWEFVVWTQNSKVVAVNYADVPQSITIGGGGVGAFADMITSTLKPKAKHVAAVHRFLVFGFTNDAVDGERSSRVWWSAIADETDFQPNAATQCDFEDLATGGTVERIIGGTDYGLIFQKDMVRTMRYVGQGVVFEVLPLNYAPGTPLSRSVIAYKGLVFYITEEGFQVINGVTPSSVGNDKVDRAFWDEFDIADKDAITAAIDPINKIVCWAYPGKNNIGGLPNRMRLLKYDENKWADVDIDTEFLLSTATQGFTLDSLDTLGTDIDNAGVFDESFDSSKWQGGAQRFAAFDQTHKLAFFTGATLAATIETGDMQPQAGRRWQINGARPLVNGGDARVSIASRMRLKDTISYGAASDMNIQGVCPLRVDGAYMRARLSLSSSTSWSHVQGIGLDYVLKSGR